MIASAFDRGSVLDASTSQNSFCTCEGNRSISMLPLYHNSLVFSSERQGGRQFLYKFYNNGAMNIFIFHGTEGYPEENWFPWLKSKAEARGVEVFVPQFPSPPGESAKIAEWFDVLRNYESRIGEDTIFVGHSLGGVFTLRILEKLPHSVRAAFLVGAPIGVKPILNYARDMSFS